MTWEENVSRTLRKWGRTLYLIYKEHVYGILCCFARKILILKFNRIAYHLWNKTKGLSVALKTMTLEESRIISKEILIRLFSSDCVIISKTSGRITISQEMESSKELGFSGLSRETNALTVRVIGKTWDTLCSKFRQYMILQKNLLYLAMLDMFYEKYSPKGFLTVGNCHEATRKARLCNVLIRLIFTFIARNQNICVNNIGQQYTGYICPPSHGPMILGTAAPMVAASLRTDEKYKKWMILKNENLNENGL